MEPEDSTGHAVTSFLNESLGLSCRQLVPLHGGRNSRVFSAACAGDVRVVVKAYHRSPSDSRDRLGTEWNAFSFLTEHGVSWVPKPLGFDLSRQCAAYEYIAGAPPQSIGLDASDVGQAVQALGELFRIAHTVRRTEERFGPASEACFSIRSILNNVEERLSILEQHAGEAPELAAFLRDELVPFYQDARQRCETRAAGSGFPLEEPLRLEARTLSPSDFGFHNALRRPGGDLVFLDFEYFGWDDPAKTVSDFLLHPAMSLTPELRAQFLSETLAAYTGVAGLSERIRFVFPLFGIKWCCILLNEFTNSHAERRVFSEGASGDVYLVAQKKVVQLSKSRAMLLSLRNAKLPVP
jgi:hypothetical protein